MSDVKANPEGPAVVRCVVPIANQEWPGSIEDLPPETRTDLESKILESAAKAAATAGRVLVGSPVCVGLAPQDDTSDLPIDAFANNLVLLMWKCDTVPA